MTNLAPNTNVPTDQGLLFTVKPPPASPAITSIPDPEKTQPKSTVSSPPPETEKILPLPELLERVFQSMCAGRRWERERLLGATDEELGKAFGTCYCFGSHDSQTNLSFKSEGEPTLLITHKLFNVEITTLTAPEVAVYVRRIAGIPELKLSPERESLLDELLNGLRVSCRRELLSYIRNMIGEKRPQGKRKKKAAKEETPNPPTLAEQIANLLFTPGCFTEASDRQLLIKITRRLVRKANIGTLKAAEHALDIIKRAHTDWRSATWYWLGDKHAGAYNSGKESSDTAPS